MLSALYLESPNKMSSFITFIRLWPAALLPPWMRKSFPDWLLLQAFVKSRQTQQQNHQKVDQEVQFFQVLLLEMVKNSLHSSAKAKHWHKTVFFFFFLNFNFILFYFFFCFFSVERCGCWINDGSGADINGVELTESIRRLAESDLVPFSQCRAKFCK